LNGWCEPVGLPPPLQRASVLTYVVQLEIEAAGVADRVPVRVPSPEGRRVRLAVGAHQTGPPSTLRRQTRI